MQAPFSARGPFVSPDAMGAAASYVEREYGGYGYSLAVAGGGISVSIFEVAHFDGSRFNIAADRWGNVRRLDDDHASATEQLARMQRAAHAV